MKLKEIHRTSTFAWSPEASLPLLATGTVAGALDESFSNESQLEIWAPNFLDRDEFDLGADPTRGPRASVTDTARFNRLAWGYVDPSRPRGVIAAGLENGELALWDPAKILAGQGSDSLILRNTTHTGPVRGLDFNPIQTSLLASGGVSGEVYIWDLKDPSKPYTPTPGARSTKLDEITSVAWNQQVQYVLAGSSSTGYTVVWDLRGKREVVALAYGGGAGTLAGQSAAGGGLAVGGRRGMSDIAWHPENATRLVTASEDDSSPIIMVWDLRNARAPEKILTGHDKGVLSLSWCKQDADLLLSCGKDNRALCWNPQTSEIIGELPSRDNWAFQVDWCPRNPDLLATAFFDGTIGIHSVQSTNEPSTGDNRSATAKADGSDIFDVPGYTQTSSGGTLSLKQPPKWLRRPISSSFGFGGKLISISNLPNGQGKNQSSVVHVRKVVTEQDLVERATKLRGAIDEDSLQSFAKEKSAQMSSEGWKALLSLFNANSRDELVTLLGFSKAEVAARVASAIENFKLAKSSSDEVTEERTHEPVVSFAEPERQEVSDDDEGAGDKTPSEISASVTSDAASGLRADGESTTTVPSLFGDDDATGTPQLDAGADFFSTVGVAQADGESHPVHVPHTNYGLDSSVAATIGSGPSSVTSEALKNNIFKIYPTDESETDRLVTKALVLGDFESAVSLCLSSERYADAILLAVRGGPELLKRTQKAYFERRTNALPYLRLFQSIVTNDLADIVQNADLHEWQEIFVVLCTFATPEDFPGLAEQLGARLEFQFTIAKNSEDPEIRAKACAYRKNATLTYLASARLERLVNIWVEELSEEEKGLVSGENGSAGSYYSAHAHALQSFIEKVTIFRSATKYQDDQLTATPANDTATVKTYKLATLYDRYFEYADFLSTQGLVKEALAFVKLAPSDYKGSGSADLTPERERIFAATDSTPVASTSRAPAPAVPVVTQTRAQQPTYGYVPASTPAVPGPNTTAAYNYQPAASASAPYGHSTTNTYAPPAPVSHPYGPDTSSYNPTASLTQPPHLRAQPSVAVPPPPRHANGSAAGPPPPPKRQDNGGWNDAPVITPSRTPANAAASAAGGATKPIAITSPFPNATASPTGSPYMGQGQPNLPPPPRPGSVQGRQAMPPPPPGSRVPGHPQPPQAGFPPHARPPSTTIPPPSHGGMAPPARMVSPVSQIPPRQPTPSQYAPPPSRGPIPGQTPPPSQFSRPPPPGSGPYVRATPPPAGPPPSGPYVPPAPSGPYVPPPTTQQPGPYAHPPPQHQAPGQYAPPVPQGQPGPYAPPPGSVSAPPLPPPGAGGPPRAPGAPAGAGVPPAPASVKAQPPPPKYPPGDRSHIPEHVKPAYQVISEQLERFKQTIPPQQKRVAEDVERRINSLFDALNCETLSSPVVEQLVVLTKAMAARDRPAALSIHVDLLTRGSPTDEVGIWMSAVKQLIMRL